MQTVQQAYELAVQYHQTGNLQQAEPLYRRILQANPQHFGALHLLGLIAHQHGRSDLAVQQISEALKLHPNFPEARNNLGNILMELGRLDEAIAEYHRALRVLPNFAEVFNNLGNALKQQGKIVEAESNYRQALANKPNYPEAYNNLGIVLETQERLAEAETNLRQALTLNPNYPEAYNNLGNLLYKRKNVPEATTSYRQAIRLKPDFAAAHFNLGLALGHLELFDEAELSLREALRLKPDYGEAYNYLGIIRREQGRLDEAVANYKLSLHYQPDLAEPHNNLANVLTIQGKFAEALPHYERALALKADYVDAHYNHSHFMLLNGDFQRGWAEYEWRCRRTDHPLCLFPQPAWKGEPLAGRTILLRCEQGMGDTLQFIRYVRQLKERGAGKIVLECQPSLTRLMRGQPAIDAVVTQGEPLPGFDVYAFLLSLPHLFGTTTIARIPAEVPYLDVDPALVEQWRVRLDERTGEREIGRRGEAIAPRPVSPSPLLPLSRSPVLPFSPSSLRVGISWQGSRVHRGDRWRSVPISRFAFLAREATLLSLQKGSGTEQLLANPGLAIDLGPEFTDFADSAAILKNLDLVITVDTALAHLAGALAVPVWVAMPFAPDWRWLLEREDSPWYPSMRLFRQSWPEDWDEVFARMQTCLTQRRQVAM